MTAPIKVYVAASSRNLPRVRAVMDEVRRRGMMITYDWTRDVPDGERPAGDSGLSPADREQVQRACWLGVMEADAVLVLASTDSRGSLAELGLAVGVADLTVVVGTAEHVGTCALYDWADRLIVGPDVEGVDAIVGWADLGEEAAQ